MYKNRYCTNHQPIAATGVSRDIGVGSVLLLLSVVLVNRIGDVLVVCFVLFLFGSVVALLFLVDLVGWGLLFRCCRV